MSPRSLRTSDQFTLLVMVCFIACALAACAASDAPRFEAISAATAEPIVGAISSLSTNGAARVGDDSIAAGDLIELKQVGATRSSPPFDRPHLLLANRDRWPGRIHSILDDKVVFVAEFGNQQKLTLPLSAVAAAWLTIPRADAEPKAVDPNVTAGRRTNDEVYLTNGDVVRGTLASLDKGTLNIDATGGAKKLPVDRVAAIVLSSDLTRVDKPKGSTAKIVLTNGARITVTNVSLQDGRLVGKSLAEQDVRLLLADVANFSVIGGKAIYLSEIEPTKYEHTPYLALHWPLARDRNSAGGWLRLGEETFDRGLGMHSQSVANYAIPNGATRFEALAGLDADVGARGRVMAGVKVDGRKVFGPTEMIGGQPAKRIKVTIPADAKELTLVVEFGAGADIQDHVNWAEARLIVPTMNRK